MAEINQKLEKLETTVQDIMQFLEIDWRSKLMAQQQILNETQKNIRLLIANPVQQQASFNYQFNLFGVMHLLQSIPAIPILRLL